jgi:type II secretory pathway pseudopilin PulG
MRARGDRGETLVEILLTVMIIGLTVTALISSLATVSNAGNAQRISVRSDAVLRNYADATKLATQRCVAGANYTVVFAPPSGFTVKGAGTVCPDLGTTTKLTLTVDGPSGFHDGVDIRVRTP